MRSKARSAEKEAVFFSRVEIPDEAEPVNSAQSLLVLAILIVLLLSFAVEGAAAWLFPVAAAMGAYYALTIHQTGHALGRNAVYQRTRNPFMFRVHFWGAIVFVFAALYSWLY